MTSHTVITLIPKDGEDVAFTVRCASGQRVDDNFLKYEDEREKTDRWQEPENLTSK